MLWPVRIKNLTVLWFKKCHPSHYYVSLPVELLAPEIIPVLKSVFSSCSTLSGISWGSLHSLSYAPFLISFLSNRFQTTWSWWRSFSPMLYLRRLYGSKRRHLVTWSDLACHCVLFSPHSEIPSYFSRPRSRAQTKKEGSQIFYANAVRAFGAATNYDHL